VVEALHKLWKHWIRRRSGKPVTRHQAHAAEPETQADWLPASSNDVNAEELLKMENAATEGILDVHEDDGTSIVGSDCFASRNQENDRGTTPRVLPVTCITCDENVGLLAKESGPCSGSSGLA
jgi:hypothetical protein